MPQVPHATLCRGSKVLVAANLHNSGALMPHYTLQLLALLAALPRGTAFLSVYESGSTDDTGTPFSRPVSDGSQGAGLDDVTRSRRRTCNQSADRRTCA